MADIWKLNKLSYIVVFGAFIYNLGAGLIDPTIGTYLEALGTEYNDVGTILASRWLIVAIFSIPFALLSTKVGQVPVLQLSAVFGLISGFFLVYLEGTNAVHYFYYSIGFAGAAASGSGAAILAENQGSKRIAAFALFSTSWMLPPAFGSVFSAWFFRDTVGYEADELSSIFPYVLYVLIIGSLLFFILLALGSKFADTSYLDDIQSKTLPVLHQFRLIFAPVIVLPLILLLMVNFLNGSGAGATLPFLPLYLKYLGADPFELSILVFALNVFMSVATQLTVPLSKKIGELKLFGIATFLSTVSLVALVYADDLYMAAVFYIARGTFANMTAPIGQARVLAYVDSKVRATGAALSSNIRWVGWSIMSPISGSIIGMYDDDYGYKISFIFTAFIYLVGTAIFIWVNATKPSLDEIREKESLG